MAWRCARSGLESDGFLASLSHRAACLGSAAILAANRGRGQFGHKRGCGALLGTGRRGCPSPWLVRRRAIGLAGAWPVLVVVAVRLLVASVLYGIGHRAIRVWWMLCPLSLGPSSAVVYTALLGSEAVFADECSCSKIRSGGFASGLWTGCVAGSGAQILRLTAASPSAGCGRGSGGTSEKPRQVCHQVQVNLVRPGRKATLAHGRNHPLA